MEEYIKYSYEVEEIPENFDEYITTINNDIREYIKNTPHLSRATQHTRDAHANGYAVLKAEVEILDNLPSKANLLSIKPLPKLTVCFNELKEPAELFISA